MPSSNHSERLQQQIEAPRSHSGVVAQFGEVAMKRYTQADLLRDQCRKEQQKQEAATTQAESKRGGAERCTKHEIETVAGYIVATEFLNDLDQSSQFQNYDPRNLWRYVDVNSLPAGLLADPDVETTTSLSFHDLETVFADTSKRYQSRERAGRFPNSEQKKRFRKNLKKQYILSLGQLMTEAVDSGHNDAPKTTGEFFNKINKLVNLATNQKIRSIFKNAKHSYDLEAERTKDKEIRNLLNGMRHELAFGQILAAGNSLSELNLFPSVEPATPEEDLNGVDCKIDARVVLDSNGQYRYPADQNELEQSLIATIGVDVKASQTAVDKYLAKRASSGFANRPGQPLVIWSHVYDRDFRLNLGSGRPELSKDPKEAALFLENDVHIEALRRLGDSQDLIYHIGNSEIKPPDLDQRYQSIKKSILDHINSGGAVI